MAELSRFAALACCTLLIVSASAATASFTTTQCAANKPSSAVNYFTGFQAASTANCSAATKCFSTYCQCLNGTLQSGSSPQCQSLSSTATCDVQSSCVQALTMCAWNAALTAMGSNATDTCSSWGSELITQLGYYSNNVTSGASLSFAGATNVGKSCAWMACAAMNASVANGGGLSSCSVYPDIVCPVPLSVATWQFGVNTTAASNDNVTVANYRLQITGDFNIFFTDALQNGKLKQAFTSDLIKTFQTTNVLITSFQNGSLVSDFSVVVPSNNFLALQIVQNAASVLNGNAAWLQSTRSVWTAAGNVGPWSVAVSSNGFSTMTAHGATPPCGTVCFQFIVILGGAAILVLVLCCGFCCVCKRDDKSAEDEKDKSSAGTELTVTSKQGNSKSTVAPADNRI